MREQSTGTNHGTVAIKSVEKAIAILRSFTSQKPELGVTELAGMLRLHKSTVSRLLATMAKGGLVECNPETGRYRLGIGCIIIASVARTDLRQVARIPLQQLCIETQETVNLAVLDADEVVNIDQVLSDQRQIRNIGWVGRRADLHSSSTGKVLLAHLSAEETERIIGKGLAPRTTKTIADPSSLHRELALVCHQGYSTSLEEFEEGLHAVAAPVRDHTGTVIAAVSVAGPAFRMGSDKIEAMAAATVKAADEISRRLGYGATP